jgi:hypothetical protein
MTEQKRDAAIDLKQVSAEGSEADALARALENGESADTGFRSQFVASGDAKCDMKPGS